MLGILMVMSVGITEKIAMLYLIRSKVAQEVKIIFNFTIAAVIFLIISAVYYKTWDFSFVSDPKYYIALSLENFSFYIAIKNYNKQRNFSQIAFASFSSIYLITVIGYIYPLYLSLDAMISTPYKNVEEMIIFSIVFFILTVIYFYDKIKSKEINHPVDLLMYALVLVNTIFFAIYVFQTHQAFLAYAFIFITLIGQHIMWIKKRNKETKIINELMLQNIQKEAKRKEIKNMFLYSLFWFITFTVSVLASKFISVEFITMFKRTGQLVAAKIIDKLVYDKENIPPKKDILVVFSIIAIGIFLYYR